MGVADVQEFMGGALVRAWCSSSAPVIVIAKSSYYLDEEFDSYLAECHAMLEVVICIEAIISGTLSCEQ